MCKQFIFSVCSNFLTEAPGQYSGGPGGMVQQLGRGAPGLQPGMVQQGMMQQGMVQQGMVQQGMVQHQAGPRSSE